MRADPDVRLANDAGTSGGKDTYAIARGQLDTARRPWRTIGRHLHHPALRDRVAAGRDAIAQCWMVKVAANRPPWTPSGIELSAGDRISVFSAGRASIVREPNVWVGSHFSLWMRIGPEGNIFRAPGHSHTFTVGASGQLYLSSLFP